MVTRLVLLKLPPVYVPPMTRLADAPGVELLKLTVVLTEAPGARLPNACGNGVPLVAPSLAVVNITLLAVTAPMFWIVRVATTVVGLLRDSDDVTIRSGEPHDGVHVATSGVIVRLQPPAKLTRSPDASSTTN